MLVQAVKTSQDDVVAARDRHRAEHTRREECVEAMAEQSSIIAEHDRRIQSLCTDLRATSSLIEGQRECLQEHAKLVDKRDETIVSLENELTQISLRLGQLARANENRDLRLDRLAAELRLIRTQLTQHRDLLRPLLHVLAYAAGALRKLRHMRKK